MSALTSNVCVEGVWYGPSYSGAGNPPSGTVTNPEAFEDGKAPKAAAPANDDKGEKAPTIERTARDAEGVTKEGVARDGRRTGAQRERRGTR